MSVFSDRLRELRGIQSQSEMAEPLGIKYQHWAKYERGEVSPSVEMLDRICRIHSVSADWLLGHDTIKSSAAIVNSPNAIIASGHNSSVVIGESSACLKCPYKKKFKAIERALKSD